MTDVVELYKDSQGEWRWHRRSENGRIVSGSEEGYHNRGDCEDIAKAVNGPDVAYVWGGDDGAT